MILSSDCCDAWYRRSVRVSMGYIFCVPVIRVNDLAGTLVHLREAVSCVSFAAVIDPDADLVLENMSRGEVPRSWCCVMGNEGNGISKSVVLACCYRLRIGMSDTVDSLSVPIATGILLHGLRERESQDIKIDAR
jgi:tRNA G18 (ribose-2'-O)-methylase SpoU